MASTFRYCLFASILLFFFSATIAQQSFRPKALVLPVSKDAATLQYVTQFKQRTPQVPIKAVVELGGRYLWVDCERNFVSSTYRPAPCRSALCTLANANGCGYCSTPAGCNISTCGVGPDNPFTQTGTSGEIGTDVLALNSTNGSNPGREVTVPRFLFACGTTSILEGLATGAVGIAGFGRTRISLPSQFAAAFSFQRKFAICLTAATSADGVILFGNGPYNFLQNVQYTSDSLTYTPLFINHISTAVSYPLGEPSAEYFIGVTAIKVDEQSVPLNSTLLSIDSQGIGGTKISTVDPYTVMESSIYNAFTEAFIRAAAARNITRVASVAPFNACFSSRNVPVTRWGYGVPNIQLVLQNKNVVWTMFGANSIVQIRDSVFCLGFVNGGRNPRTSIVIGGHQLEDNLLLFDLAASRLGFSSLLFGRRTTCANFNFTSSA